MNIKEIKKCIVCEKELNRWKRLFCGNKCYRIAHSHVVREKEYILTEAVFCEEIIKLKEFLGEKKELLDEARRQLAEEIQLEMLNFKK